MRVAKKKRPMYYTYVYIYTWNLFVLYFGGWTLQNKVFSKQTRAIWVPGTYIYMYIYIYIRTYILGEVKLPQLTEFVANCPPWPAPLALRLAGSTLIFIP